MGIDDVDLVVIRKWPQRLKLGDGRSAEGAWNLAGIRVRNLVQQRRALGQVLRGQLVVIPVSCTQLGSFVARVAAFEQITTRKLALDAEGELLRVGSPAVALIDGDVLAEERAGSDFRTLGRDHREREAGLQYERR